MIIGILVCGRPPASLEERHGAYDGMFRRLLAGRGFTFRSYAVLKGNIPADIHEAGGWLITGSRFGAYEDHAWIPPLEDFLRRAYAAAVPIVGVCFGHQIFAQALGGKVEKFAGGWSIGRVCYDLKGLGADTPILAFHQDQVVEKPAEAQEAGASPFCRHAAFSYGGRAYTVQPHPEFGPDYLADLLQARRGSLPADRIEAALQTRHLPLATAAMADRFELVFKQGRR
ncbi:MAG: type 1 glutamine amidotransferase [Rhodospirillales bacterium]|nr:type 1 glutamine amidotransferase [Rhodospirillales bacterium]